MTYSSKWFAVGLYFEWAPLFIESAPFSFEGGPLYIRLGRWDADKEQ